MTTIKGPAVFLAQFISDDAPFNSLENICKWAAGLGFKGIQMPTLDKRFIDLQKAAESKTYADDLKGTIASYGLEITELSTHLQGQLVAVHPAYDDLIAQEPKSQNGMGSAANEICRKSISKFGVKRTCYFQWILALAVFPSMATTSGRFSGRRFCRTGQTMDAYFK